MRDPLTVALPKGRLLRPTLERLERAGIRLDRDAFEARRLLVEDGEGRFQFLLLKAADIPIYVEHGSCDVGVCGLDRIEEAAARVLIPLDLGHGACRLSLCGPVSEPDPVPRLSTPIRVATGHPRLTLAHFNRRGIPVEVVRLSGSIEAAIASGLAARIVDLVETGRTLRANGLQELEVILPSTARLIVNPAAYRLRLEEIQTLIRTLEAHP